MRRRALRENGATAVSMAAISSALLLLGRLVTAMLSLEVRLLGLSLLWAGLYLLQRALVGRRRCSDHWFVQYGAMAGYYLPAPVAFSAASALCYSTSHVNESFPQLVTGVLAMFSYTILASSVPFTNMRSYSLRDRPGDRCTFLKWLVLILFVFLQWEWASLSCWLDLLMVFTYTILAAFVVLLLEPPESTLELDCQTRAVADYMKRRKASSSATSSPFFDDDDDGADSNSSLQLGCCRYPFARGKDGEWVTVKDLVQRDDLPNEDQDIWLSYSLCRLLARRYYGFHCTEEGDDMVRRFALAELGTRDGYKRAFKTVEVQLAFLHDYFFTSSLPIIEMGSKYIAAAPVLWHLLAMIIMFFFYFVLPIIPDQPVIQMLLTLLMCILMSWWHLCLLAAYWHPRHTALCWHLCLLAAYWHPIHTALCKFNRLPDLNGLTPIFGLLRRFCSSPNPNVQDAFHPTGGVYWRNKIGQYSILQDYDRHCSPKKAIVAWFQVIVLSQPSYKFIKHLPVEEEEEGDNLKLDRIRKLVAETLHSIDGPPTNGTRSLKINMDSTSYDWSWTCKQETHTDTILIWHIATCYCGMSPPYSYWHNGLLLVEIDTWYEVATALSRYCAYLVAFLPEFLLEHSLTTKQVFQNVIQDAQRALGSTHMEEEEKRTKFRGLWLRPRHGQTTFHKGIMLGRQLEKLNTWLRWKVMAEFWAEMILYVAPSDNAAAHMEHLAKGGEFITHLWAMLSNAGILKGAEEDWHPPASTTKKRGPPKKIDTTKARTQECPF